MTVSSASGATNRATVVQYSSHMKQVWQSSWLAITGGPSGTASNTLVGQALTQMSQRMQRESLTNSIMIEPRGSGSPFERLGLGTLGCGQRWALLAHDGRALGAHVDLVQAARDQPPLLRGI